MTAAEFWNNMADRYAARPVGDEASYEATLAVTRSYLTPSSHVLEIGCGTGSTALRLMPDVGQFHGTDFADKMIAIAAAKTSGEHVTFSVSSADAGPDGPFDMVIAFNLLHLLDDVPRTLARVSAQLKPGGVFLSKSAVLGEGAYHLARIPIAVMRLLGKAPYVKFMNRATLGQMITDAGLIIEDARQLPEGSRNRFIVARKP
ncbi:MAG: class I SAM-dependent methyltransferase [Yoonia sp.]|nr:class I SAM-dependent methyltransferase [Yoonia sp.]